MLNLCALILKAVNDFLIFLIFYSKYFFIPNLFLISLYVLNFDIFYQGLFAVPKLFIYFLPFVLYRITMKQGYKY